MQNPNPTIYAPSSPQQHVTINLEDPATWDDAIADPYTPEEVYELIRSINDPEHPLTLESLSVVCLEHVRIIPKQQPVDLSTREMPDIDWKSQLVVRVDFTPTIPHCSMATLIGLCIRVKLWQCLRKTLIIDVRIREGMHVQDASINKQLADKERVAAALENDRLASVVQQCLHGPARVGIAL